MLIGEQFSYICGTFINPMSYYQFTNRHNGPDANETASMLQSIGIESMEKLITQIIPADIRLKTELNIPEAMEEHIYLRELRKIATKNKIFRTFIGLGYYNTMVPGVIQRNILENPGWYTAYTPYQAEIANHGLEIQ